MSRATDPDELFAAALDGDRGAIARMLSLVERGGEPARVVGRLAYSRSGSAYMVGLTGAPGSGKSTLTSALIGHMRSLAIEVAVLAIDPSSPFTGGAILGDRVRMQDHATDPGVYIRSMSSRGHLGGLSAATPQAVRVLEGAGCDVVLVETVGVGQAEVEVASLADTTIVLLAPGMGDAIQAAKAGILEVADVFVVNKADREGADQTARDLRNMLSLGERRGPEDWQPLIVKTVAAKAEGVDDVVDALEKHRAWLASSGRLDAKRRLRAADEIEAIALTALRERIADVRDGSLLDTLAGRVVAGETDPYAAADELVAGVTT